MDLAVTDASTQQNPVQMDEEFTTTAYPSVQENLKLLTEDQVILEEPASSTRTLSSLQNLDKELSFTDQFFVEKPQKEEPKKTNAESEVQSMVTVPIHQDTSSVPPMTTLVIDLTTSQSDSSTVHAPLPTSTATTTTTTTLPPPPPQPQQSTADPILLQRIALSTTYQAPAENSLLEKTGDMRTFMNWYCQKVGKTELTQADFKGQAYEVLKAFYPDDIHLQFQIEECHKILTDQIDWANPEGDQVRIDISRPLPLKYLIEFSIGFMAR
ncbi:hypothetical protein Tco_1517215 [Tanacetum coccineum]